jgi:hypothetical protein
MNDPSPATCVECDFAFSKPGDVNQSGSVTSADIIWLVGFIFKGQAAPMPCQGAGDVNCTYGVNSADIIHLVNFVFKGGPVPCDQCTVSWVCW